MSSIHYIGRSLVACSDTTLVHFFSFHTNSTFSDLAILKRKDASARCVCYKLTADITGIRCSRHNKSPKLTGVRVCEANRVLQCLSKRDSWSLRPGHLSMVGKRKHLWSESLFASQRLPGANCGRHTWISRTTPDQKSTRNW